MGSGPIPEPEDYEPGDFPRLPSARGVPDISGPTNLPPRQSRSFLDPPRREPRPRRPEPTATPPEPPAGAWTSRERVNGSLLPSRRPAGERADWDRPALERLGPDRAGDAPGREQGATAPPAVVWDGGELGAAGRGTAPDDVSLDDYRRILDTIDVI
jgi:hypothetical protein